MNTYAETFLNKAGEVVYVITDLPLAITAAEALKKELLQRRAIEKFAANMPQPITSEHLIDTFA